MQGVKSTVKSAVGSFLVFLAQTEKWIRKSHQQKGKNAKNQIKNGRKRTSQLSWTFYKSHLNWRLRDNCVLFTVFWHLESLSNNGDVNIRNLYELKPDRNQFLIIKFRLSRKVKRF